MHISYWCYGFIVRWKLPEDLVCESLTVKSTQCLNFKFDFVMLMSPGEFLLFSKANGDVKSYFFIGMMRKKYQIYFF